MVATLPALIKEAVVKGKDTFSFFEYLPNKNTYKNENEIQQEENNTYQEKLLIDNLARLELKYTIEHRYNIYNTYDHCDDYRFISVRVPE